MNEESYHQHILTQSHWGQVLPHIAVLWFLYFHSKSHLAFMFFSVFQCFVFLPLPPTPKGSKSKRHFILLITFTDNLHRKEINTFLRSYSDNKSCVSSHQSWVWRVQGAVAPWLLQFRGTGPGCDFILISTSVWATNRVYSRQPACSTSQINLYSPKGNLHLLGLFFSIVHLLGHILSSLKNQLQSGFSETCLFVKLGPPLSALV